MCAAFDDAAKFKVISTQPYRTQAVDFLNAYWARGPINFKDHPEKREMVWDWKTRIAKLDKKGEKGNELDEFQAHRFLEHTRGAMTVQEMRRVFAAIDLDGNHHVSLCELLIFQFEVDWHDYVNAPKSDTEKVSEAQAKTEAAQAALQVAIEAETQSQTEFAAAQAAVAKATADEAASVERAALAKTAEDEVKAAREAQEAALAAVTSQEKTYQDQLTDLEGKSADESLSTVKRNKAKAELAQLKQEDPLPLRKARIGNEAALRRLTKAVKQAAVQSAAAAAAATEAAKAHEEAEKAKALSEEAVATASSTRASAETAMKEAAELLEVTRLQFSGSAGGSIWFMGRELEEAKKFMPKAKILKLEANLSLSQSATAAV